MLSFILAFTLGGLLPDPAERTVEVGCRIAGRILDYTHNHGVDRRIYSEILCQPRDLYVYLPPCYDPNKQYPLIVWCHGAFGDETGFVESAGIEYIDTKIQQGCFPPVVVIVPDTTIKGEEGLLVRHSMLVNGVNGRYEDHFMQEVLPFVTSHFSIRPDREGHAICGYSGGSMPAMALAIKHREFFGSVTCISGPLNLRYSNVYRNYFANFNPKTYRWAEEYRPWQKITRYWCGLVRIPAKFFVDPIFGSGPGVIDRVKCANPADLIFSRNLQPGELNIYMRIAGRDNFNFDAQMDSFIWLARQRGIAIESYKDPNEYHSSRYCTEMQRRAYDWLASRIAPPLDGEAVQPTDEPLVPVPTNEQALPVETAP